MANVGSLFVVLGLKAGDYQKGLKKATKEANTAMNQIKREFANLDMKAAALGVAATATAFVMLQKKVMDTAGSFQQMQVSLDTITKGQGKKWFNDLLNISMELPVSINGTIKAYQRMKSMGLDPTIKQIRTLLDVQSAMGGDEEIMLGISRALGQMAAKGKVSAEELMQLAERGIPAYQILRDKLNLTAKEVYNIGNKSIDSHRAISALFEGMGEMFGGNAAKMANTYSGQITLIMNQFTDLKRLAGDIAMPQVVEQLKELNTYLKENKAQLSEQMGNSIKATADMTATLIKHKDAVVVAIEVMFGAYAINKLVKFATSLGTIYTALTKLLPLMAVPSGLAAAGGAIAVGGYGMGRGAAEGKMMPFSPYGAAAPMMFPAKKYSVPDTRKMGYDITAGTIANPIKSDFYALNNRPGSVVSSAPAVAAAKEENKLLLTLQRDYERGKLELIRDEGQKRLAEIAVWYKEEQAAAKGNIEALRVIDKMRGTKLDVYDQWHQEQLDKATMDRKTWLANFRDNVREQRKQNYIDDWNQTRDVVQQQVDDCRRGYEKMKADSLAFSAFWANNLISVVEQSGNSFNNIAQMFSNMIKKMMIQASVMGAINWLTGGVGGFVGGFKASLQGRASGGPISANTPYLVGERGPEIIMPKTAGTVIPNSAVTHDNSRWELHFHDTASERKGMTLDDDTVFAEKFKRCVRDRRIEIRKLA